MKAMLPGYKDNMKTHFPPGTIRTLTTEEAISGVEKGPLSKINGMDLTTSTGFTSKHYLKKRKKGDLLYQDEHGRKHFKSTPEAQQILNLIKQIEDSPNPVLLPVTGSLKDELLPLHKVEKQGKIRLFSNVDCISLVLTKKYIGFPVGQMQHRLHLSGFTAGIDPRTDYHQMYQNLATKPHFITYDFSKFDKKLPLAVMKHFTDVMLEIMEEHYTPYEYRNAEKCMKNLLRRVEVFEGHVFLIKGGSISGEFWTNFIGSGSHEIMTFNCVFTLHHEYYGRYPTWFEVRENVVIYHHGDDGVMAVSAEWAKFITFFTIQEKMKSLFGMTITPALKDATPTKFTSPQDVTFLACHFKKFGQKIVGVLQKSSLEKNFSFTKKHTQDHYEMVFTQGLEHAALHGKKYFNQMLACAEKNGKAQGFQLTLPTFRDVLATLLARQQQPLIQFNPEDHGTDRKITELSEIEVEQDIVLQSKPQKPIKMNPFPNLSILCKVCKAKGDVTWWETHVRAHPEMEEPGNSHKARGLAVLNESYEQFHNSWKKDKGLFNPEPHFEQVSSHKVSVDICGKAIFGRSFPAHDLSKYTDEEALPYTMRWVWFLEGEAWDAGLKHHYENNPHHYEYFKKNGDQEPNYPTYCWDEAIADTCGCLYERKMGENRSPIGALKMALDQWDEGKFLRFGPQSPTVVEYARQIYQRLTTEITKCPYCPVVCKTPTRLIKHVESAHPQKQCPSCTMVGSHTSGCESNAKYQCMQCECYFNDNQKAVRNHQGSCKGEGRKDIRRFTDDVKQQSNFDARPTGIQVNETPDLDIPQFGNGPGMPDLVAAAPGYTADWHSLLRQKIIFDINTVATTSVAGSIVARYIYGDTGAMQPYVAAYADQHRFMHGPFNYHVKLFGASNYSGSIMVGVVPDAINFNGTIPELQAFGNWNSLSLSGMSDTTMVLNNADTRGYRPRAVGDTTGAPGLILMVEQPVVNTFGEGNTILTIQTSMYMGPTAGFTYVLPFTQETPVRKTLPPLTAGREIDVTALCQRLGYRSSIAIDGKYHYKAIDTLPTMGPDRVHDPAIFKATDSIEDFEEGYPRKNISTAGTVSHEKDVYMMLAKYRAFDPLAEPGEGVEFRFLRGHVPVVLPEARNAFLLNTPRS